MPTKQQPNPFFNATGFRRSLSGNDHSIENLNTIQGRNIRLDNPAQWQGSIDFKDNHLGIYTQVDYETYASPYSVLISPPPTNIRDDSADFSEIIDDDYDHAHPIRLYVQNKLQTEIQPHSVKFEFDFLKRKSAINLQWLYWFMRCPTGDGNTRLESLRLKDDLGHWTSFGNGLDRFDFDEESGHGYSEDQKVNSQDGGMFLVKIHGVSQHRDYRPIKGFIDPLTSFPTSPSNHDAYCATRGMILSPVISITNTAPASPVLGDRYLVAADPCQEWAGHVNDVVTWSGSEWVFGETVVNGQVADGVYIIITSSNQIFKFVTDSWVQQSGTYLGSVSDVEKTGMVIDALPNTGDILYSQKRRSYMIANTGAKQIDLPFIEVTRHGDSGDPSVDGLYFYCYEGPLEENGVSTRYGKFIERYNGGEFREIVGLYQENVLYRDLGDTQNNSVYFFKARRAHLSGESLYYDDSESNFLCGTFTAGDLQYENQFKKIETSYYTQSIWQPLWNKDFVYIFRSNHWHVLLPDRIGGLVAGADFDNNPSNLYFQFRPYIAQIDADIYTIPVSSKITEREPVKASLFKAGIFDTVNKIGYKYLDVELLKNPDLNEGVIKTEDLWANMWKGPLFQNSIAWQPLHYVVKQRLSSSIGLTAQIGDRFLIKSTGQYHGEIIEFITTDTWKVIPEWAQEFSADKKFFPSIFVAEDSDSFKEAGVEFVFGYGYDDGNGDVFIDDDNLNFPEWKKTTIHVRAVEADYEHPTFANYVVGDRFWDISNGKFYRINTITPDLTWEEETNLSDFNQGYIVADDTVIFTSGTLRTCTCGYSDNFILYFRNNMDTSLKIDKRQIYGKIHAANYADIFALYLTIFSAFMGVPSSFAKADLSPKWVVVLNPASWGRPIQRCSFGVFSSVAQMRAEVLFDWIFMPASTEESNIFETIAKNGGLFAKNTLSEFIAAQQLMGFFSSSLMNSTFYSSHLMATGAGIISPMFNFTQFFDPTDPDYEINQNMAAVPTQDGTRNNLFWKKDYVYVPQIAGASMYYQELEPIFGMIVWNPEGGFAMYNGRAWDTSMIISRPSQHTQALTMTAYDPTISTPPDPADWQLFISVADNTEIDWEAGHIYRFIPASNEFADITDEIAEGTLIYETTSRSTLYYSNGTWAIVNVFSVKDVLDDEPTGATDGNRYLVSSNPLVGGSWEGHANEIMMCQIEGETITWHPLSTGAFAKGMQLFIESDGSILNWNGTNWKSIKAESAQFLPVKDITYTPPVDPAPSIGDRYLVDRSPAAGTAWEGKGNNIAEWNGSSWEFSVPSTGNSVIVESEKSEAVYEGSNWLISSVDRKSGWPLIPLDNQEVCIWLELGVSISIDTTSGAIFKITCSNPSFPIYWNGYKIIRYGDVNDQIDLASQVASSGFYQIYYDSSSGPENVSLWISEGYSFGAPPGGFVNVATIYVNLNQTPTKYLISYDPHSIYQTLRQHLIDHTNNGFLRTGGCDIVSISESTISINNAAWLDEDLLWLYDKTSELIPVIYRDSLSAGIPTWNFNLNPNGDYYLYEEGTPNLLKYDNEGSLTNVSVGFCLNIWLILTNVMYDDDTSEKIVGKGIFAIIGQRQFASLNDALTERFDELALGNTTDDFITNEFVPLHRITLRSTTDGIVLEQVQKLFDEPFEKVSIQSFDNFKYVNAQWDPNLSASGSYSGNTAPLYVGESVVFGNGLYLDASTKQWKKIDASVAAAAKLPGLAIALQSKSAGEKCLCLMNGFIRNSAWSFTAGDAVYASASTAGALSTTPPSTSGHFIQVVGQANDTDILYLHPEITVREV